jgi:peptidoglycan lytic transglycosylase
MNSAKCQVPSAESRPRFSAQDSVLSTQHCVVVGLVVAVLGGCGTVSKTPTTTRPGANPPANIDSIPDAVPRVEPVNRGTARPYVVMGKSYTPMTALAPYKARGIASWYGRRYHGKATSSGEPYDMYAMTAAHTTLPIPSYVRVTNVKNGKSVVVRINDRGPFVEGRIIDLSYTAAHRLGVLAGGAALVEVETLIPGGVGTAIASAPPAASPEPGAEGVAAPPMREPVAVDPPPPVEPSPQLPAAQIPVTADAGGYYLQLGAFGSRDNAENFLARMRAQVDWLAGSLHIFARDGLFRVHAGPYAGEVEARRDADRVTQSLGVRPFVLTR